jgi:hypothetical protein
VLEKMHMLSYADDASSKADPELFTMIDTARKAGSDGCIQVLIGCGHPIQTWARATK